MWSCCTWQTTNVDRNIQGGLKIPTKGMKVTVPVPLYSLKAYRRRRDLAPLIPNFGARQR
jgi:hypothetical protein